MNVLLNVLSVLKKNGFLNFYDFQNVDEFEVAADKVKNIAKKVNRKVISSNVVACGQYAPKVNRVCVDAQIE